jgi:hypothetical protein
MADTGNTSALTKIIEALKPLDSEERHRTVDAAMMFLGETVETAPSMRKAGATGAGKSAPDGSPAAVNKWMKQYGVSADETFPHQEILLRWTAAFKAKWGKFYEYAGRGLLVRMTHM